MNKMATILIIFFVLGCAGQNIKTTDKTTLSPMDMQDNANQKQNDSPENKQQNMSFRNIDDAYTSMSKKLDQLSENAVKSAFEIAVNTLKKDPGHIRANIVLFNAHLYQANKDQTIEQFKKMITLNPKTPKSCIELGTLFARLGKISEAIVFFQRSLELDNNFVEGYYNLGRAYSVKHQFDQSIEIYEKNIELDPKHYRALNNLGWIYMIKKDYQKALKYFNKALETKPDYSVAYLNIGTTRLMQKKNDAAEKNFQQYINLKPEDPEGYRNLATVYQKKQEFDHAITALRELLKHKPDDYVAMNNLAVLLLSKARYGESFKLLHHVYHADIQNNKFKTEVKKNLAKASYHLAETLAENADKKNHAVKAYKNYLKYSDNLSQVVIQQINDKIDALQ